jgi:hypothetical protein
MLRAVQRYNSEWPSSHWSKLELKDIPSRTEDVEEEEDEHVPSEEKSVDSSDDERNDVIWTRSQAQDAFEVSIDSHVIVRFLENISGDLIFHIKDRIYFNTSTHANVDITIAGEPQENVKTQLWAGIRDFAVRVTKPAYWNDKDIPIGYQIMSKLSQRVNVVWFLPRIVTPHIRSFLQVNLIIWPNSMSVKLHVAHVTENRQILFKNEPYRVIELTDVAAFAIMLTELHKSDYMFICRDRPNYAKIDIKILKFKIPHPGVIGKNLPDRQLQDIVSAQATRITEACGKCAKTMQFQDFTSNEPSTNTYVYNFKSNSNKEMCITIHVQDDGPYTEIALSRCEPSVI